MTSPSEARIATRFVLAGVGAALIASCGRSPLPDPCPAGFTVDASGRCVCDSSRVCPDNLTCVDGACRCTGPRCCPPGHDFVAAAGGEPDRCVCSGPRCCPDEMAYDPRDNTCNCAGDACCPAAHRFDLARNACVCDQDDCCPVGYAFDAGTGECVCASDECCPADTRFDEVADGCTCASTDCCPERHVYSEQVRACVCTGVGCCPEGFRRSPDGGCLCAADSACPPGLECDIGTGRCICRDDTNCADDAFCNAFGFCQSLTGCGSNLDCPDGFFCDVEAAHCLRWGTCGRDSHCPIGSICAQERCQTGCRTTADCHLRDVCIAGRCMAGRCEDHTYCSLRSFCDTRTQTCGIADPRYCRSCDRGCQAGPCLSRIIEGDRAVRFCGVPCADDPDCPGEMVCSKSYSQCPNPGGPGCPDGLRCTRVEVLNEGLRNYCADPTTGVPSPIGQYCAPRTGGCD